MKPFEGKTALVTGGGRGIGREIALMLARNGADVGISSRTRRELEDTAREVRKAGRKCLVLEADISDGKQVKGLYSGFMGEFGKLDLLFNNAGVAFGGEFTGNTLEQIDLMIDVNYRGLVVSTHEALKHMKKGGIIINTASVAGKQGFAGLAVYSGTKFAVIGFTEALAQELEGRGIRAYSVCPGATKTRMWDELYPGSAAEYSPSEVAEEIMGMLKDKKLEPGTAVNVRHHRKD